MAGGGQRVNTEDLKEFARRVRGLLKDFEAGSSGKKVHGRTGLSCTAFGSFGEATDIGNEYNSMRDRLRDVLNDLEAAIDDAQKSADRAADDIDENDHTVAASFKQQDTSGPGRQSVPADVNASWQ